jgi:hypothetical protein
MARDRSMRERMGNAGLSRVKRFFYPARLSNEVEDVYRRILAMPVLATGTADA